MTTSRDQGPGAAIAPETVLLLNRATLLIHQVRSAVHELNNALLLISGSAEMLAASPDLPADAHRRLESILGQADRSGGILRHLSAMARDDGTAAKPSDVGRAAADCIAHRRHQAVRLGISVSLEAPADGALLAAVNRFHLEQMLLNLLLNAERAAAPARTPRILVRLSRHDGWIEVSVIDTGPGVEGSGAEGDVFDPFVTTAVPGEAAGLGLPAVRILAESSGGTVTCDRVDEGFSVTVRLPAAS